MKKLIAVIVITLGSFGAISVTTHAATGAAINLSYNCSTLGPGVDEKHGQVRAWVYCRKAPHNFDGSTEPSAVCLQHQVPTGWTTDACKLRQTHRRLQYAAAPLPTKTTVYRDVLAVWGNGWEVDGAYVTVEGTL